jgi:hypothetical protein
MDSLQSLQLNCVSVGRCRIAFTARDIPEGGETGLIGTEIIRDVYTSASRNGAVLLRMSNGKFVADSQVNFLPSASAEAIELWVITRQQRNAKVMQLFALGVLLGQEIDMFASNLK